MLSILWPWPNRIVQFSINTMGMEDAWFQNRGQKSANTLSCLTVELRYLCIMRAECIGYRQIIWLQICCPKSSMPTQLMGNSIENGTSQSGLRNRPDWENAILNEIQWETTGQHYPATIPPKPDLVGNNGGSRWPIPNPTCDLLIAGGGFGEDPKPDLARRKGFPLEPLPKEESLSAACSCSSCWVSFGKYF